MTTNEQRAQLARCMAIDKMGAAYLAAHPESPRYCYSCQKWLISAAELSEHPGHSIH